MDGLLYLHPDDDLAQTITPTLVTGTQDPTASPDGGDAYGIANLGDEDPSHPWKSTNSPIRLVWDLGTARPVRVFALIHPNLPAGSPAVAYVERNSGNVWSAPPVSEPLVASDQEDGFPANPYVDFGASATAYRYLSLRVDSLGSPGAVSIGEVVFASTLRQFSADFRLGATDDEEHPTIENRSANGGVQYVEEQLTRRRWLRGAILLDPDPAANAAESEQMRAWFRASRGRGRPFLVLPRLPLDEAWWVRWENATLPRTRDLLLSLHNYPLAFEEVPRGLAP